MQVVYSKTFLKDLSKVVPLSRRKQIEKFVFEKLPALSSIEIAGKIEKLTAIKIIIKYVLVIIGLVFLRMTIQ